MKCSSVSQLCDLYIYFSSFLLFFLCVFHYYFYEQFSEMYTKAGFSKIKISDNNRRPGNDIHEMGGVRMGREPNTSLLNSWNQLHHCKNVFVTDGSCMTSTSTQNPSLTFMAITARAANYAINQLKKGNI